MPLPTRASSVRSMSPATARRQRLAGIGGLHRMSFFSRSSSSSCGGYCNGERVGSDVPSTQVDG
jgi:hypothetical protein